jgi:argininosuccinate lyase
MNELDEQEPIPDPAALAQVPAEVLAEWDAELEAVFTAYEDALVEALGGEQKGGQA